MNKYVLKYIVITVPEGVCLLHFVIEQGVCLVKCPVFFCVEVNYEKL